MTVKELIRQLDYFNPEMEVMIYTDGQEEKFILWHPIEVRISQLMGNEGKILIKAE